MLNPPCYPHGFRPGCRNAPVRPFVAGLFALVVLALLAVPVCAAAVAPAAAFTSNVSSGTIPLSVQFIDSTSDSPVSWAWSFGDGSTSLEQFPVHTYSAAGTYTVTLTASNAAGSDTATGSGYITARTAAVTPAALFYANTSSGTIPLSVQFMDSSTNSPTSWAWSFGDGGTSMEQNPVHTYSAAGTYTVTLTATNAAGSNTVTKTGSVAAGAVSATPQAAFLSTVESGTAPLTVRFVDTSVNAPTSWAWSFGDGNTSTEENPSHTYVTEGTYTVTLTATNAGGSNTVSKAGCILVTYTAPVAGFTSNVTKGAAPLTVLFTDTSTSSPTSWLWKFGDGETSTSQNPVHEYPDTGTFTVSLTAKNSAGSNLTKTAGYITVTSVNPPVVSFAADVTEGTVPLTVRFDDTSSPAPVSWLWSFGDGTSSTEENPVHTYVTAGTYSVTLSASNEGGTGSTTAQEYITGRPVNSNTRVTTVSAPVETTMGTIPADSDPAEVMAAETAALAAASPSSASFPYSIAGIIAAGMIGLGALLFFRRPPRGGHHPRDSRL